MGPLKVSAIKIKFIARERNVIYLLERIMLGERLKPKKYHILAAKTIADVLIPKIRESEHKYIIAFAGESGAGKSVISNEFKNFLKEQGVLSVLIQQDDYYKYPPRTNYILRRKDISCVGVKEVKMELLQTHIDLFRKDPHVVIKKPLPDLDKDIITEEQLDFAGKEVLIVEGTYVSVLKNIDKRVYISRNYKETLQSRLLRGREQIDEFDKDILEKEHTIVSTHKYLADIIIDKDYSVRI